MSSQLVSWYRDTQLYLFQTIPHTTYLPFPILDLLGAIRLSVFVDQYVRGKARIPDDEIDEAGRRPTYLQEAFAIAVLVFGGETFLAAFLGVLPSWMQSPNGLVLFCGMHYLISRTSLHRLVPRKPLLSHELPLSPHDSLGRALVLTTFSFDLIRSHKDPLISTNPYLMVLSSWIMVVPSASAAFAFGLFEKEWHFSTPGEMKPDGWKAVDFWAPPVIAWLYGALTHAHPVFLLPYAILGSVVPGLGLTKSSNPGEHLQTTVTFAPWDKLDARAFCAVVLTVLFALRAVYNFGGITSSPPLERPEVKRVAAAAEPSTPVKKIKKKSY